MTQPDPEISYPAMNWQERPPAGPMASVTTAEQVAVSQRLTWLLVFRSLMMGVLLIATVLINLGDTSVLTQPPQILLYVTIAFSFFVILVGAVWQARAPFWRLQLQVFLQIGVDVLVATVLVFATGGAESTFLFLYSLTAINGAALRYRPGGLVTAAMASIFYGVLLNICYRGVEIFGVKAPAIGFHDAISSFVFNVSAVFLVALLASYVSEQMRQAGESLEETLDDLGRLEALHTAVVSSLTSGLMAVDQNGNVALLNESGERFLSVPADYAIGRPAQELIPDLVRHIGGDSVSRFETNIHQAERTRFFGVSVAPLRRSSRVRGSIVTFQDLTEVRDLEQQIQRSERLASVGRFAAGLAHELRNPLGSMTGCVELLRSSALEADSGLGEEQQTKLFDIVLRETERLNKLVSDFLVYARPSRPVRCVADLALLVGETVEVARREHGEASIELQVRDADCPAFCDVSQIKQIIWNLLRNAIQASGEQGRINVAVGTSVNRAGLPSSMLTVDDSGAGIPAEIRSKVVEPFFTTKEEGTGLGLSTVHRIVEDHQGDISIGDSPLGGASVRIILPSSEISE